MDNNSSVNNFSFVAGNVSNFGGFFEGATRCPKWVLYGFLASFFLGSCFNLLECFVLIRCKRDGILSLILQITLVDTLLSLVATQDLFSTYHQTWTTTGSHLCMLYNGTATLGNTLLIYLLVCLNFHIITFCNLHNTHSNKNPLTSFGDGSSSECLVTRSDSRMVTIDYKKRKNDVSVMFPVIFLWVLSMSISMPVYVLSTTVNIEGASVCVLMRTLYGKGLNMSILFFSALLPSILLLISLFVLLHKLRKTRKNDIDSVLTKQFDEIKQLLIFSVVLTIFYVITSYQRHIFNVFLTVKEILFQGNYYYNNFSNVYQTMWHYSGTGLRGLMFYLLVPGVKKVVRDKLFCYRKES